MPWADTTDKAAPRSLKSAVGRGLAGHCPRCGEGRLFSGFLKVEPTCSVCHEDLSQQRADDFPPYVVMFIVGHIIVAMVLYVETVFHPPMWLHMVIWLPLATALMLVMLQPVKGAIIGLQWANRMHGFGGEPGALA